MDPLPSFRAFLAFELSPEIRQTLSGLPFREKLRGVSWVKPENIHGTLKFLGTISSDQKELLEKEVSTCCRALSPFSVTFQGLGVFPNLTHPRVFWIGTQETTLVLLQLVQGIETLCRTHKIGDTENRPYQVHLTLARIKQRPEKRFFDLLQQYQSLSIGTQHIHEIVLFKSDLQKEGAIYTKLLSFSLLGEREKAV